MTGQYDIDSLAEAYGRGEACKQALLTLEDGMLSEAQVAARLGIPLEEVRRRRVRNELFILALEGELVFPAFQFGPDGLLLGITAVLAAFTVDDPWMRVNFMLTGDRRLDDLRPIDALRAGRIGDVVQATRAYGEHGAA